jgi:glutamate N-acetyltransferase/amino-acid N-acetyltransferase
MTKFKAIKGNIASPKGFMADAIHAELKFQKLDLGLILSEVPAAVAGVFTTNKVAAAPIDLDKAVVAGGVAQAIIVNSAIANAVTGDETQTPKKRSVCWQKNLTSIQIMWQFARRGLSANSFLWIKSR